MENRKRLNGLRAILSSNRSKTCPNCGREFREYKLIRDNKGNVHKVCPYCGYEIS